MKKWRLMICISIILFLDNSNRPVNAAWGMLKRISVGMILWTSCHKASVHDDFSSLSSYGHEMGNDNMGSYVASNGTYFATLFNLKNYQGKEHNPLFCYYDEKAHIEDCHLLQVGGTIIDPQYKLGMDAHGSCFFGYTDTSANIVKFPCKDPVHFTWSIRLSPADSDMLADLIVDEQGNSFSVTYFFSLIHGKMRMRVTQTSFSGQRRWATDIEEDFKDYTASIKRVPNKDQLVIQAQTKYQGVGMSGNGDTDFGFWKFNTITGELVEYLVLGTPYNDYAGKFSIFPDGNYSYVFQNAHPSMSESSYVIGITPPNGRKMSSRVSHGVYIEDIAVSATNSYLVGYRKEDNSVLHQGVVMQVSRKKNASVESVHVGEFDRDEKLNKIYLISDRGFALGSADRGNGSNIKNALSFSFLFNNIPYCGSYLEVDTSENIGYTLIGIFSSFPNSQPTQPISVPSFFNATKISLQEYMSCKIPSLSPTLSPTYVPSVYPSGHPSLAPSYNPTLLPSEIPTSMPTNRPTGNPLRWGGRSTRNSQGTTKEKSDKSESFPVWGYVFISLAALFVVVMAVYLFCNLRAKSIKGNNVWQRNIADDGIDAITDKSGEFVAHVRSFSTHGTMEEV
ncbi:MAG: PT domain-containing protein [Bacteroidota bacterium]